MPPPDSYFLAPIIAGGGGGSGGGGGGGGSGRWRRRGREQGGGRRTRARHDARAQGGGRGLKSSWRQGRRQGGPQEGQVKPRHVHGPRAVLRRRPSRGVKAHFRLVRVGLAKVTGPGEARAKGVLQRGEQEAPGPDGHGLAFLVVHELRGHCLAGSPAFLGHTGGEQRRRLSPAAADRRSDRRRIRSRPALRARCNSAAYRLRVFEDYKPATQGPPGHAGLPPRRIYTERRRCRPGQGDSRA